MEQAISAFMSIMEKLETEVDWAYEDVGYATCMVEG